MVWASQVPLVVKEPAFQCRRCKRWRSDPWVKKSPGVGNPPSILSGESHGERNPADYVHRVAKSQVQLK